MKIHPLVQQLVEERRAWSLGLEDVAKRSGYSCSFLQKLECGHRRPNFVSLHAWAGALGFDIVLQRKVMC